MVNTESDSKIGNVQLIIIRGMITRIIKYTGLKRKLHHTQAKYVSGLSREPRKAIALCQLGVKQK